MRSFENWFGIPLRFFILAIFLSMSKRSFNSIFKVLKLFRTKRVRLSVNINISCQSLAYTQTPKHTCATLSHLTSLSLEFSAVSFSIFFIPFTPLVSLTRSLIITIMIFGVETCMSVWVWSPISLFVCTMALANVRSLKYALRCPPHNILYIYIHCSGFHWALKEMETTKYFSVNQSQWIIREHIYYIRPLGATNPMVFHRMKTAYIRHRKTAWIGKPNTFSHFVRRTHTRNKLNSHIRWKVDSWTLANG